MKIEGGKDQQVQQMLTFYSSFTRNVQTTSSVPSAVLRAGMECLSSHSSSPNNEGYKNLSVWGISCGEWDPS